MKRLWCGLLYIAVGKLSLLVYFLTSESSMHKQFFYQPFLKLDQNENFGFENFCTIKV